MSQNKTKLNGVANLLQSTDMKNGYKIAKISKTGSIFGFQIELIIIVGI